MIKNVASTLLLLFLFLTKSVIAQQNEQPLPLDPHVRHGRLDNGLTYYIRHNEQPKDRANFYLVHKVGSLQEEEQQRGLAHFLEHMAFNGSKHFSEEQKSIKEYAESIGMRFGDNLNAYTSFDRTVYMLNNAPVKKKGVIDSCLLVLYDWCGTFTLTDSMIDKERGIVHEEWRTRSGAQSRIWEQHLPKLFPNSRYGQRMPLGLMEVVDHFKYDELRTFYNTWYRPDLQAIIIVGDIDAEEMELTIKTHFADIPKAVDPTERVPIMVEDNQEPLVAIAKDRECTETTLTLYYKHENLPESMNNTISGLVMSYLQQVIASIMSERFYDLTEKANSPVEYAFAYDGNYLISTTKGAWTTFAQIKPDSIEKAMNTLVTETKKVKLYGVSVDEYDRARTNIIKHYESAYNEREKQQNSTLTNEYLRHFTDNEPAPGIEMEFDLISEIATNISLEVINEYVKQVIGEENIAISLSRPDKESDSDTTEEDLIALFRQANTLTVEPNKPEEPGEPLLATPPTPGEIVETMEDALFGTTIYRLSNGAQVVIKPTEHRKDQILMRGSSPGGSTLFEERDLYNQKLFNQLSSIGGLGTFTLTDLDKMMAGKRVSCGTYVGNDFERIFGSCSQKDLRTLFELIYLSFTAPRHDEEAFSSFMDRLRGQFEHYALNPSVDLSDTLTKANYGDQPRAQRLKVTDLEKINYERILEMYNSRYGDASDFTFTFVGTIEKDSILPLIKQYLASLPAIHRQEKGDVTQLPQPRQGLYKNRFQRPMESPKSTVVKLLSGIMEDDLETRVTAALFKQIMTLVFTEKMRENESATYGVSTSVSIASFPKGRTSVQILFDTNPKLKDKLINIVEEEVRSIGEKGPKEVDFRKSCENMIKNHEEELQENGYWLQTLDDYYFRGYDGHTAYLETLQKMSPMKVQLFTKKILDQGNFIEVVMEP